MTTPGTTASETASNLKRLLKKANKISCERDDAARLDELRRIFATLIGGGELDLSSSSSSSTCVVGVGGKTLPSSSSPDAIKARWNAFLRKKHDEFVAQLCEGVRDGRKSSLRTFCGVIASSPRTALGGAGITAATADAPPKMVDERLLYLLIESIANPTNDKLSAGPSAGLTGNNSARISSIVGSTDESLLTMFYSDFVKPHRDVQYFALHAVKKLAVELYAKSEAERRRRNDEDNDEDEEDNDVEVGIRAENLMRILLRIDGIAVSDDDLADVGSFLVPPPTRGSTDGGRSSHSHARDGSDSEEDHRDDDDDEDEEEDGEDQDSSSSESEDEPDGDDDDDDEGNGAQSSGKKRRRDASNAITANNNNKNSNKRSSKERRNDRLSWQRSSKHRRALQESWLAVLKVRQLPPRSLKRALRHLPASVLPNVPTPLRFADFCTRSYEVDLKHGNGGSGNGGGGGGNISGGVTSLLALHGLFVLMTKHGLEYPKFYASLYNLIHPRAFYAKHRTRFFTLLNQCLARSDMLPAYCVAAFCKRLCRCALVVPPSGSLFVLALVSNLLRTHGECACLIHRGGKSQSEGRAGRAGGRGEPMEDGYDAEADDPAHARALESSLWELDALTRHYHPAVAALAASIGTEDDRTTPLHDMDEFLVHTYKSLFEQERKRLGGGGGGSGGDHQKKKKRRVARVPLTFEKPKGLFTTDDVFGGGILSLPEKNNKTSEGSS